MSCRVQWLTSSVVVGLLGVTVVLGGMEGSRPEQVDGGGVTQVPDEPGGADSSSKNTISVEDILALRQRLQRTIRQIQAATSPKSPVPEPTIANAAYGSHPRQVLDFWKAESSRPTPLIVFIHGGGFVGGDKRSIDGQIIDWARQDGISVAAIHYRFVTTDPFPAPMHDAARAIQFLRSKADRWNLDPDRIAAYGGSAGAGLSLWLGFHDDLADPHHLDLVARQSTRLCAVGSIGGQSTYDPVKIRNLIGGRAWEHPSLILCYNLESVDDIDHPDLQAAYDEASAITHLTADDPPVFMIYSEPDQDLPPEAGPGIGIHHPRFGHLLSTQMEELGIEAVYRHRDDGGGDDLRRLLYEFLREHLRDVDTDAGQEANPE